MKKIKVIFTGGTIGSLSDGNDINVNDKSKYILLEKYGNISEKCKQNLNILECASPINILSENACIKDVLQMAFEIKKAAKEDIKGIILTHGSDTLAYSCAYLSFLLGGLSVPVVMVASNLILTNVKANGVVNFAAAVDLINNENTKPAVYVAYKNPEEDFVSVHLGSRMKEPYPYSESFYSPKGYRFATWQNGNITYENTNFTQTTKTFDLNGNFSKSLLYVHPYTGLNYDVYKNAKFDYVLHNLYHSGTANTQNYKDEIYNTSILDFANYCKQKNIPIYLCNIAKKDVNYNSTNQMMAANVKFLYDIMPNIAIAKLNIAHNLIDSSKINEFLDENMCGEILN